MKTFEISLIQLAEIFHNAEILWGADYVMVEFEATRQLTAFAKIATFIPQLGA